MILINLNLIFYIAYISFISKNTKLINIYHFYQKYTKIFINILIIINHISKSNGGESGNLLVKTSTPSSVINIVCSN